MTDPISPIRAATSGSEAYQPVEPARAEPAAAQAAADQAGPARLLATRAEAHPPATEAARSSAASQSAAETLPNVHYRFNIDPKTNDVTVIMFDASSHKVLRTIPAKEMQKLTQGELLSLWA